MRFLKTFLFFVVFLNILLGLLATLVSYAVVGSCNLTALWINILVGMPARTVRYLPIVIFCSLSIYGLQTLFKEVKDKLYNSRSK